MTLVISLTLIALISAAMVAFFSFATSNRRIEESRANRTRADILAGSGGAYATAQLLAEITSPTYSDVATVQGVSIYRPHAPVNAYPRRIVSPSIKLADANYFNLIRQSVTAADTNASAHGTATAAANGRSLGTSRWNTPLLLAGPGFSSSAQLPNWIYIDRNGGITTKLSSTVIGRFAYNVYDIGGLLNANAAGFPSGLSADQTLALRSGQGAADLTSLTLAQADVDKFLSFRYPDSPAPATYVERMLGASENGFLAVRNLDPTTKANFQQNMFVGRQDLLRYARLVNTKLASALPYLTHFSRSLNAPSFAPPATPAAANADLLGIRFPASAAGKKVSHIDDQGTETAYSVRAGDPFVQRRFSLAKLAWLTCKGPSADLAATDPLYNAGGTAPHIQACFGLAWNKIEERWEYVGPKGNTILAAIETLTQVAAEATPREPNFFETLKAGIADGSLGAAATGKTFNGPLGLKTATLLAATAPAFDASKDLHVIQIGANIIDNADSDNYPTRIALNFQNTVVEKAGVEDLPYFFALDTGALMNITTAAGAATTHLANCEFVWVPELFCPHRASTPTSGPTSIQVDIGSGTLVQAGFGQGSFLPAPVTVSPGTDLSTLPAITVPATQLANQFQSFRNGPQPVINSGDSARLGSALGWVDASLQNVLGFRIYSYPNPIDIATDASHAYMAASRLSNVVVRLRYLTPGGNIKTYATLGGSESLPANGITGVDNDDFGVLTILKHSDSITNLSATAANQAAVRGIYSPAMVSWDPRSGRFGPAICRYRRPLARPPLFNNNAQNEYISSPRPFYPNYYVDLSLSVSFAGPLPAYPAFRDPDGTVRPPDGNLGYTAPSSATNSANPYNNLGTATSNTAARPIILQRPYRSVAELGYVFRDIPFQTLDFFNAQSADAALLDLFSVTDQPAVVDDRVFLGTPQSLVLQALLKQTAQEPDGSMILTPTQVQAFSTAFLNRSFGSGSPLATFPQNASDIIPFMASIETAGTTITQIKSRREALARALATSQSRTWNVLIDVVAQTGRFPRDRFGAGDFVVEGESRQWVSRAIDRYTGNIVDQQSERVSE